MGKVTSAPGIQFVNGSLAKPKKVDGHKCGDYLIGTHRTAETTNPDCTRLYIRKADVYTRKSALSQDEKANQLRFKTVAAAVAERRQDLSRMTTDQENFLAQKDAPNGKKTMKSYLWSLEMAIYDQAHNG